MKLRYRLLSLLTLLGFSVLSATGASAQGLYLHAILVGGNEVPGPGHATAYGAASVLFRGANFTQVCTTLVVTGLPAPTAAHIHVGFGPQYSGPLITIPTPASGNPGFSGGCTTISAALSAGIRTHPQRFYINVHTAAHPNGAIRGQLFQ
jgi:hypothetical protein